MKTIQHHGRPRQKQRGMAAVEFALIAMVFFTLLLGILEFGRVLFTWNSAVETTRYGARVAVVCDIGSSAVLSSMQQIMPDISSINVAVTYEPSGCSQSTCERVKVKLQGLSVTPLIPFLDLPLTVPAFETSLLRESLSSTSNPVCS